MRKMGKHIPGLIVTLVVLITAIVFAVMLLNMKVIPTKFIAVIGLVMLVLIVIVGALVWSTDGKIRFVKQTEINKVELCFYKNGCWKCHRKNDVYFVNRLFSQEGVMIDGQHLMMDEDITFNPSIIKGLKKYIYEHPSETFIMGEIKPRYSKTIGEAYPSFGCAQCDSIFGNFYLQENMMELMYCTDSLRKAIITLDEPIKVLAHCWYKVNN